MSAPRLFLSLALWLQAIPLCVGLCYALARAIIRNRNRNND